MPVEGGPIPANVLAFVDVTVVPMDREVALGGQTVVIEGTRITQVGSASDTPVPPGATVHDGTDLYLMPGLCDMHVHLASRDPDPAHLVLYLAEGTTTVRALSGDPANELWRARIDGGELFGPTILTSGPTIAGPLTDDRLDVIPMDAVAQATTRDEAVAEVQRQIGTGVDLIKVYDGLDPEAYRAAIETARRAGVYVTGHLLDGLGLEEILAAGLDEIAHVDELNTRHWRGVPGEADFVLDHCSIPATAELLSRHDVVVVSNLSTDEIMVELIEDTDSVLGRPAYRVVPPRLLDYWRSRGRQLDRFAGQGSYRRDSELPFLKELLGALDRAGVIVLVGTDTAFLAEGTLPSQIHRDIELLVEAGFSNFSALAAATARAAEVVSRMAGDGRFGTVVPGNRADLVLLEGNPLDDVSETRRRAGVMARGRFWTQAELDDMVDALVAGYSSRASA